MRKAISLFIFAWFLSTAPTSFSWAQAKINETTTCTIEAGSRVHALRIEFPGHNQAKIENLTCDYSEEASRIDISAKVKNTLPRPLIQAIVKVECFNLSGEILAMSETKVLPLLIKQTGRRGYFTVSPDYNPEITSCQIDITWQGKAD